MRHVRCSVLWTAALVLLAGGLTGVCRGEVSADASRPDRLAAIDMGGKPLPDRISLKSWWKEADASPGEDAILVFTYKDTAKAPTVVMSFNGIGGEYGANYVGQFGGAGDGQTRRASVYVPRNLIARDKDGYLLRFHGGMPEGVSRIEVIRCTAARMNEAVGMGRAARAAHIEAMKKEFKEDPWKETATLGEVDPQFKEFGFIPYVRNWNEDVFPGSIPKPSERGAKALQSYATPGAFEPIQAAAYALKDVTLVARISDLTGPGTLKADKDVVVTPVECTAVRSGGGSSVKQWQVKPAWLRPNAPQSVKANTSKAWYITVHVPTDAKPGVYKGTFGVRADDGPEAKFPIEFRVLPFTLDKCEHIARGAYVAGPVDDEYVQNMLEHSLNAASAWPGSFGPAIVDGKCVAQTTPVIDRYLRHLRRSGFVEFVYFGGGDPRYDNPAGVPRATDTKVGSPEFAKYYGQYWQDLRRQEKANGWPTLVCCPFDEPVKSPEKVKNYEICYDIVKEVLPDMKVWCVFMNRAGSAKTIGRKAEIWSCNGGFDAVLAEKKKQTAEGAERHIYTYTVCMVNQRPGNARFNSGVNPFKYDADGVYFWAYLWYALDPFDDLDGGYADWTPAARDVDGRIYNTVAFEGWRAGLDDRLYIETCARMARQKKRADVLAALEKLKQEVSAGTESDVSRRTSGLDDFFFKVDDANQLDVYRARVVQMILEMLKQ